VNQLFARKRKEMNTTTNDVKCGAPNRIRMRYTAAFGAGEGLDDQRRQLLTRAAGNELEQTVEKGKAEPLVLAGPVLGALGPEQQTAHPGAHAQSGQVQDYLASAKEAGESPDPAELVAMREQTRHELREQLTDEQLEEFLLRTRTTRRNCAGGCADSTPARKSFRKVFNGQHDMMVRDYAR